MSRNSGIGLFGVLALVFIVLKLAEIGAVAQWSWFWVLSPILLPWMAALAILAVAYPTVAILGWFKRRAAMRTALRD